MCIFCKIVQREIPSHIIYEDESTLAFLDISPSTFGHTLVIPKKHYDTIYDVDQPTLHSLISSIQKVSKHIKNKTGCKGINIIQNNEEMAGQTVFHIHFHIIPRHEKNDFVIQYSENSTISLQEVYDLLK